MRQKPSLSKTTQSVSEAVTGYKLLTLDDVLCAELRLRKKTGGQPAQRANSYLW